ncbi:hypothetical protein ACFL2Q_07970 [Thermodesulfobacteriota bacterium]
MRHRAVVRWVVEKSVGWTIPTKTRPGKTGLLSEAPPEFGDPLPKGTVDNSRFI